MEMPRRKAMGLFAAGAATVALGGSAGAATGSGAFVIRDARVFDGERVLPLASVLVADGRIRAVGDVPAPGVPVHDGRGRTLLPGLIDCHVHLNETARADALRFGVTTELDMFGDPSGLAEARRQRRGHARTGQADLWSAGFGVTVPDGHPRGPGFPRLTPGADPDAFVGERVAEGSDFIKLVIEDGSPEHPFPTLTPAQARAVVQAAHRRGRLAVAHAEQLHNTRIALEAGADALVHVWTDTEAPPELVTALRAAGTFVVPTLSVYDCGASADSLLADPRITPYLSAPQRESLTKRSTRCRPSFLRNALANIRRLHAEGVPVLAGTDATMPGAAHGPSMLTEIAHLVTAGLTQVQALAAATSVPAKHFALHDRGRIARGQRADLLLVEGDPTTDITALREIHTIWKNGYPVERMPA
ncbi:amidohydrolase family protein [Crossiella sp. NPDC003009]